jgi:hypothetical protein
MPTLSWEYHSSGLRISARVISTSQGHNAALLPLQRLDAVVLHEGVIDTLPAEMWSGAPELALLALCPRVLRSSGRGSLPRRLARELPFIEFSEVSDTLYRSRNKPGLGKAICSVAGFAVSSQNESDGLS